MSTTAKRRGVIRRLAVTSLMTAALTGSFISPASAAASPHYGSLAICQSEQRAYGSTGFVRITRSCYQHPYQAVGGVWILDAWRFNYKARTY